MRYFDYRIYDKNNRFKFRRPGTEETYKEIKESNIEIFETLIENGKLIYKDVTKEFKEKYG